MEIVHGMSGKFVYQNVLVYVSQIDPVIQVYPGWEGVNWTI